MDTLKTLIMGLLGASLLAADAGAATITWSSLNNAVDTDVLTEGGLIEAANFGGTDVPDVTVNTVLFPGVDFPGGGTLSNISGLPYNNFQKDHATATGGQIDTLFDTIGFLSGDSFHEVELTGLTPGVAYKVQFFIHHPPTSTRTLTLTDGASGTHVINNAPGGIVTGEFTADGTTQAVTLRSNQGSQLLNGYQLRVVPEPASLALLGIGGLAFLNRRGPRRTV